MAYLGLEGMGCGVLGLECIVKVSECSVFNFWRLEFEVHGGSTVPRGCRTFIIIVIIIIIILFVFLFLLLLLLLSLLLLCCADTILLAVAVYAYCY